MAILRTRNAALLMKIEAVAGTEETLDPAADGITIEAPSFAPNAQSETTDEATGSLDGAAPIVGGLQPQFTFGGFLKGSGAAGTAPEIGKALQVSGWLETVTATQVPTSGTTTATGGTNTTFTVDTSVDTDWSSTDQAYRGMMVELSVNPTTTTICQIVDYTLAGAVATVTVSKNFTSALDGTTEARVLPNVLYSPISSAIKTATAALFNDGIKHTVLGSRGTWTLSLPAGRAGRLSFTVSGKFKDRVDAAVPSVTLETTRPPIFRNGVMTMDRINAAVATLTLDNGNQLVFPEDPNEQEGFAIPEITRREISGTIDPAATLVATRNLLAEMQAGDQKLIVAQLGTVAGNRVGVMVPKAQYSNTSPTDRNGILAEATNFTATGADAGGFFCFF